LSLNFSCNSYPKDAKYLELEIGDVTIPIVVNGLIPVELWALGRPLVI